MRQTEPGGKTVAVVEAKVTPEEVARLKRLGLDHGQVRQHLDAVNRLLQDDAVERVEPVFRAANEARIAQHRAEGMARSGVDLADLGLYLHIVLKPGTDTREAERLVDRLNASPIVEIAYPAPIAALGGATQTPSFTNWQGYLGPPPFGIDVAATWSLDPTGGRGYGVRVADTEAGWDFNHEDFPRAVQYARPLSALELDPKNVDHGTAVIGVIAAQENGFGVTGIAPRAQVCVSPPNSGNPSDTAYSIYFASLWLGRGDAMIILQHCPGPESPPAGNPATGTAGYVPVEFYPATGDAVRFATARGIIVVEIAGNGGVDFDNDLYYMLDRAYDSGAILVGATKPDGTPEEFSNSGSRVDLNAWGDGVMTLGSGSGYGGQRYMIDGDAHRCYWAGFGGTCSAASIVTGAVVSLQGVVRNQVSASLTPSQMRYLLAVSGTPQAPGRRVGPRPNLRQALALLFTTISPGESAPSIAPEGSDTIYAPSGEISAPHGPPPVMQLAGMRLKIYLDNHYEGSYSFSDDGSIEFFKLDGSVERRLRFTQSGSDLTLFTAAGAPVRGSVSDTGFTVHLPIGGGRTRLLRGVL